MTRSIGAVTAHIDVQPREHAADCRRSMLLSRAADYGLDAERCERCRAIVARLAEAREQLKRRGVL